MTLELFLILLIDNSITDIRVLYQRPKTGSLHFYSYYEIMSRDATQKGVNALNGLSSFLHIKKFAQELSNIMCQRPKRALFISTNGEVWTKYFTIILCQRPKRALFIST